MKSLKILNSPLSQAQHQAGILEQSIDTNKGRPSFAEKLESFGLYPINALSPEILQINVGKMCNQVCRHCHVDAGPDRKEIMQWETMEHCMAALRTHPFRMLDITGGAPEMNPFFVPFIEAVRAEHPTLDIWVRCNLTIIVSNKKYHSLPDFYKKNQITIVSSLPYFEEGKTDRQRGEGVFQKSITALKMLNDVGYGQPESNLHLHLVYNPAGAFLPGSQEELKQRFKEVLLSKYHLVFNDLFAITNLPISRFLDYLLSSGNFNTYMDKLIQAFNPMAIPGLMCRNTISVGWDGFLYDCDFNQMLEIPVTTSKSSHISTFNPADMVNRSIAVGEHCYGCTAGSGSSCGGATVS